MFYHISDFVRKQASERQVRLLMRGRGKFIVVKMHDGSFMAAIPGDY